MRKTRILTLCWLFLAAVTARPAQFSFQTLDNLQASAANGGTTVDGVSGSVEVGYFVDTNAQTHGFIFNGSSFTELDEPASVVTNGASTNYGGTFAAGVQGGEVVGWYVAPDTSVHGFLYTNGSYTSLEDPNDLMYTAASGISGTNIVGSYLDQNDGYYHGFIFDGSNYTMLTDPDAATNAFGATFADGIDGGNVVGYEQSPASHGFIFDGTNYATIDYPGAAGGSVATGISGANIVGYYQDQAANTHGFLFDGASYTSFDFPDSTHTYAMGISGNTIVGYYTDTNNFTNGFVALFSLGSNAPVTGLLQVTISPLQVVTAGAQWQVDGGAFQASGAVASNLTVGQHLVSFRTINGWATPDNQSVTVGANATTAASGAYNPLQNGSLVVDLAPSGAVSAGAAWQVDGGAFLTNGAMVTNLVVGPHTVSFATVFGWVAPADETVSITNHLTTTNTATYTAIAVPADGLVLATNGYGAIQHGNWPSVLVPGEKYTLKAIPEAGNLFEKWEGGTNLPYTVFSRSASYTFTMEPGLELQADFVTNIFLSARGTYLGLFAPTNGPRQQTNSGAFNFSVTANGALSGSLRIGIESISMAGKFNADGEVSILSKRGRENSLTTFLQLDPAGQMVSGTVSNGAGGFVASLVGYQSVFNSRNKTTNFAGRYSLTIPGVTNPAVGPFGTSYGTVTVGTTGSLKFAGSLADGTAVNQSSVISGGGYWPMYLTLYRGRGSLWSWNYFATNGEISSVSGASWINPTNSSRNADYRAGFTNQQASIVGGLYLSANQPLSLLTNAYVVLQGGDLSVPITNQVAAPLRGDIVFASTSNNVSIKVNPATGLVSGSFTEPNGRTNKIAGVLQSNGIGVGYFPDANQSGSFILSDQ